MKTQIREDDKLGDETISLIRMFIPKTAEEKEDYIRKSIKAKTDTTATEF